MEKKSKKGIIIGVTSLLLVTLILLGLTYAYYRTRIIGNDSTDPSISVTSKKLEVTYQDDSQIVESKGAKPGEVITKTFSVENTGTATGEYSIILDNIENTMKRTDDLTYELKLGSKVVAEGIMPSNKNDYKVLVSYATVEKDTTNEYTLTIKYANLENIDQSEDMGAKLSMRVNIANIQSSWNGKVNEPVLSEGMIPVKWNDTDKVWVVTTEEDTEWYNYVNQSGDNGESLWANVMLSDGKYKAGSVTVGQEVSIYETGSMFVWIPRYEYKIDSSGIDNVNTFAGTIDIKFIPVSQTTPDSGYDYVHPAFRADASLGGWDTELNGIWVSKYEAGYQAGTVGSDGQTVVNATDTVIYSDKFHTISPSQKSTGYSSYVAPNYFGQDVGKDNYMNVKMSYPVFRAATYSYNYNSIGDNWTISRDMMNTDFYGLANADTHMIKNSEWGAVAYLAHSNYGRAGVEVSVNERNKDDDTSEEKDTGGAYMMSGYNGQVQTVNNATASNSTTNNMTGVFDMNGGIIERTAAYIKATTYSYVTEFGASFTTYDGALQTNSTKYATVYAVGSNDTAPSSNFKAYKNSNGYGDAILETDRGAYTSPGANQDGSWFKDLQRYPYGKVAFFVRGGRYDGGGDSYNTVENAGLFAYKENSGDAATTKTGFRVSIVVE